MTPLISLISYLAHFRRFTFYKWLDDWLRWWFLWGWVEGFSLYGDWFLPLLSTLNSSHWNDFKLMFLFWFWWALPIYNLKSHIIISTSLCLQTLMLKTKILHLEPKQSRHGCVCMCLPLLEMQISFSLAVLSLRPYFFKRLGLMWECREFFFPVQLQLLTMHEPERFAFCHPCDS